MAISNSTDRFNGVVASLAIKVRCVVAAEANVAALTGISNPYSGINIADLDRILLVAQTDPIENGVWDVHADGVWTRAFDWDGNRDVEKGSTIWAGQSGGLDKLWQVQTAGVILPGSTAVSITILIDPETLPGGQPNPIILPEIAGAMPSVLGEGQVWVRDDDPNVLVFTDDLGTDHDLLNVPLANPIVLAEIAGAGASVLGFGKIWVRDDNPNVLVFTNDLGTDTVLGSGGGGGIADGTVASSTLRWSGSAWVESTNVQIASNGNLRIIDTTAIIRLESTSAPANEKRTELRMVSSSGFVVQAVTDGGFNGPVLMNCSRTGSSWDTLQLQTDVAIFAGDLTMEGGSIYIDEVAAASANKAAHGQLWVNLADDSLNYTTEAGVNFDLTAGGGGPEVNDLTAAVTWANIPDANVPASAVTQHVGAIDHDSLLNFLAAEHVDWAGAGAGTIHTDNYIENATHTGQVTGAGALALDVTAITAQPASGALIGADTLIVNDGGVLSEVTMDQINTFVGGGAEVNDLSAAVTWVNVPDANITVGSVTQHVASIDHDGLLNFVAAEHIDWSVTGAEDVHTDRIPVATTSAVGGSELATTAERITGTDAARTLTPATAQKFVMVTPVVISFGGDDTWATINNAALGTAGATHALIKCFCQIAPTGASFSSQVIHLRETGSAIAKATSNRAAAAVGEDAPTNLDASADTNDAWVKLNSGSDFDILQDQVGTGTSINQAWIIGYMA